MIQFRGLKNTNQRKKDDGYKVFNLLHQHNGDFYNYEQEQEWSELAYGFLAASQEVSPLTSRHGKSTKKSAEDDVDTNDIRHKPRHKHSQKNHRPLKIKIKIKLIKGLRNEKVCEETKDVHHERSRMAGLQTSCFSSEPSHSPANRKNQHLRKTWLAIYIKRSERKHRIRTRKAAYQGPPHSTK